MTIANFERKITEKHEGEGNVGTKIFVLRNVANESHRNQMQNKNSTLWIVFLVHFFLPPYRVDTWYLQRYYCNAAVTVWKSCKRFFPLSLSLSLLLRLFLSLCHSTEKPTQLWKLKWARVSKKIVALRNAQIHMQTEWMRLARVSLESIRMPIWNGEREKKRSNNVKRNRYGAMGYGVLRTINK